MLIAVAGLRRAGGLCRRDGGAVSVGLGLALLALSGAEAHAAAVGTVVTAVGPLTALATLFAMRGWSAYGSAVAPLSAGLCVLGAGVGATWLLRHRTPPTATVQSAAARGAVVLPEGWEQERLLCELRDHFLAVQCAWDLGDVPAMQGLATPQMLKELLLERGRCADPTTGGEMQSEVITLNATLIGFDETPMARVVSVEFSGSMREAAQAHSVPFRELWMLLQSTPEKGAWRLARHHTLM